MGLPFEQLMEHSCKNSPTVTLVLVEQTNCTSANQKQEDRFELQVLSSSRGYGKGISRENVFERLNALRIVQILIGSHQTTSN